MQITLSVGNDRVVRTVRDATEMFSLAESLGAHRIFCSGSVAIKMCGDWVWIR